MKFRPPKPFFFEGGPRAVLLLHAFTGSSGDVRRLGRFLNKKGYTVYAPNYSGHAVDPEELLGTSPTDWWQDVVQAYGYLGECGYPEIAVCGLSIGGVFSLKCGYTFPVKGIVPMCAPANSNNGHKLHAGVLSYAKMYKKLQGKTGEQLAEELRSYNQKISRLLNAVHQCINEVRHDIYQIHVPAYIVQARQDEMIDLESAGFIYNEIQSEKKQLKWYEQSTHAITLGAEKEQLNQDIFAFLESLDWSVS